MYHLQHTFLLWCEVTSSMFLAAYPSNLICPPTSGPINPKLLGDILPTAQCYVARGGS